MLRMDLITVQVKSNGAEGWANYANQLNQQWY